MEALSRGARRAVFVDEDAESVRCTRRNLAGLGVLPDRATVHQGSLPSALDSIVAAPFDLVFADPPYAVDASALLARLSSSGGILVRTGSVLAIEVAAGSRPRGGSGWQLRHVRRYGGTEFLFFVAQFAGNAPSEAE
jgi:16S rRNA (guanine966-N2)-methyltransferase